jgi:hypothetical protein
MRRSASAPPGENGFGRVSDPMATKEVLFETFFTKAPGQDKLRKTAEGRLKFLVREGWHEAGREPVGTDSIRIRFEREGATRLIQPPRRKPEPRRRGFRGDRGDRGGPRGAGGGPRGAGGGPRGAGGGPRGAGGGPRGAGGGAPSGGAGGGRG